MLYYERVQQPRSWSSVYAASASAPLRASEETVRPGEARTPPSDHPSANTVEELSVVPNGDATRERERRERREKEQKVDPRVVRRVSAGSSNRTKSSPSVAQPPPLSRSTSANSAVSSATTASAVTAVSTFSHKTVNGYASMANGHPHPSTQPSQPHANGNADPNSPQRPPLPPSSPSKSSRLRKARKSVSHGDGNPSSHPPLRA